MDPTTATLEELGRRLERVRLERDWTQAALAEEAGVAKRTVERLEHGESVQLTKLARVLAALGLGQALVEMVPAAEDRPMQQLRRKGRPRRRASGKRARPERPPWTWGDPTKDPAEDPDGDVA